MGCLNQFNEFFTKIETCNNVLSYLHNEERNDVAFKVNLVD